MPSASSAGPSAVAAPNATAAAAAWTNVSMPEMPLFHLFAVLDGELHAAFPGLWLALMAVHGVIFLVGLVLNGLALYVFGCRTQARTPSVIYTINLVVTDLLVGLSLPTRFAVFYGTRGCLRCALPHVFGYFLNMHCSILFLTCICVDRYLAIVQPDGGRRWRQPACARAVCAFVWLAAGAVTLSVLGVTATGGPCCRVFALTVLEFLLPLLVISIFTGRIMCALSRPGLLRQGRQRRMRAMQLLLTVLVIFLVCFTPFHARQVAVALWPDVPHHTSLVVYHVAVTLSSLNSCMDPIVYCFVTSSFQTTVRGLFHQHGAGCEPNSCNVVSTRKSSKNSSHRHILGARPRALTQALANGPEA
ncbi:G-protein coupled receptor 20 [Lagenorhynchus albirostris]|uniref:G-protein coupled receptor 20 n=1 Tax=Lagenorhynchus albirostris TaxID=27610 RepID=UPI0028EF8A2E|nr:G-protein coupled receptor 20 [Lagenorhynchus albirostris]XP_059984260.1 G-protein coupled receptor 20 [Lagenorhynchus albirostris]XP_059984261.1 G-protein coupled receptor 20 [Lagenorhynchus albirostris]